MKTNIVHKKDHSIFGHIDTAKMYYKILSASTRHQTHWDIDPYNAKDFVDMCNNNHSTFYLEDKFPDEFLAKLILIGLTGEK